MPTSDNNVADGQSVDNQYAIGCVWTYLYASSFGFAVLDYPYHGAM
jgi:hypothetical protein